MKKILLILTTIVTTITSGLSSIVCCSNKNELKIIFVPSREVSKLQKTINKLENLLENKLESKIKNFNMKVKANIGTDYTTAGQTLVSGMTDISFLPSSVYSKFRGNKNDDDSYDAAAVLLLPTRNAIVADYNVFKENINNNWSSQITLSNSWRLACEYKKLLTNINNRDEVIAKLYKNDCDSPYYRSVIYANKEFLKQFDFGNIKNETEYCVMLKQIINKAISNKKLYLGNVTSSAGTIYPLSWMKNTLDFNEQELKNVIKNRQIYNSYTDAIEKLANGEAQISTGYGDMRLDCADANKIKQVFENIEVIGSTEGIATDAIQYSRKSLANNYELIKQLRISFCELINDPNNSDIFDKIYAHKRYCKPNQNDEASSKKWEIEQDKIYTEIDSRLNDIFELQKKFTI